MNANVEGLLHKYATPRALRWMDDRSEDFDGDGYRENTYSPM